MILNALLLSALFLASNNLSYNYACTTQAQVSFASTYASDNYANNICTFEFSSYYNDDENYVSYLSKINLTVNIFDDEDDLLSSSSGSYVFATPVQFDLDNDTINVSYVFDGLDLDYKFTYNNIEYLITLEDFYFDAAARTSVPFPTISFSQVSIPFIIRSSLEQYNYNQGYTTGYDEGYDIGHSEGHQEGWLEGVEYAGNQDETALTIFEGIITIALVPINFFLAIFNFEIFGINLSGFVSALLTVSIIIIVVRFLTGKKQGSDD